MVNISKVIGALAKLEGNSARVTLTGKQLAKLAEKKGAPAEVSEAIAGLARKHPQLKADVGYKVSEQGFTVGAMTIRDGKTVIGTGAGSVTGLGTEEAVLKMRMQLGKNGEIFQYSGYNNLAQTPRIQDMEIATSMKNGVVETSSKIGEYGASRTRYDIPKATEALGVKNEAQFALNTGNSLLERFTGKIKDFFAGKEVGLPVSKNKGTLHKAEKVSDEKIAELSKKPSLDIESALKKAPREKVGLKKAKDFYKMPSGKNVPKEEFEKTIEDYFKNSTELGIRNPDKIESIAKELSSLAKQVKEQTGYEVKGDWTKYLGDAFKI